MDAKHVNPFIESFYNVIPQLGFGKVGKGGLSVKEKELNGSGVIIIVGIVGSIKGNIVYCIDYEGAKKIASTMMLGTTVNVLGDIEKSALSELTNMLTANAATCFANAGISIDISTPTLLYGENVTIGMSADQVLCVRLLADDVPIDINIAFENE